ncbi:MAG: M15 family metallopeptidase [Alphaproteobacteria bacterium]
MLRTHHRFFIPRDFFKVYYIDFNENHSEAKDRLVKFLDLNIACESYYNRSDGDNWPYLEKIEGAMQEVWGREAVALKLLRVNQILSNYGLEVYVLDAYRSIECQRGLWSFFTRKAMCEMPDSSEEERRQYVLNYVSDPSMFALEDSRTWPTHSTGAAIDLFIRHKETGRLLDMGARFDETSSISHSDFFERKLVAGEIADNDARLWNRRLLHLSMQQVGFTNYPLEFWHFDYGNEMYIRMLRMFQTVNAPSEAWYGYMENPEK